MKITALQSAVKMMADRGYVVIGFPGEADCGRADLGQIVRNFAGASIAPFVLQVNSETDRADWDAQCVAIFGSPERGRTGENIPAPREAFYRCALVSDAEAVA